MREHAAALAAAARLRARRWRSSRLRPRPPCASPPRTGASAAPQEPRAPSSATRARGQHALDRPAQVHAVRARAGDLLGRRPLERGAVCGNLARARGVAGGLPSPKRHGSGVPPRRWRARPRTASVLIASTTAPNPRFARSRACRATGAGRRRRASRAPSAGAPAPRCAGDGRVRRFAVTGLLSFRRPPFNGKRPSAAKGRRAAPTDGTGNALRTIDRPIGNRLVTEFDRRRLLDRVSWKRTPSQRPRKGSMPNTQTPVKPPASDPGRRKDPLSDVLLELDSSLEGLSELEARAASPRRAPTS